MTHPRLLAWFSGSGNSRHVAERLSQALGGAHLHRIAKLEGPAPGFACEELGLVFPVHSFRVPILVRRFLEAASFGGVRRVWAVLTMGGGAMNAGAELRQVLKAKGLGLDALGKVVLPDDCIYLYNANSCRGPAVTDPVVAAAEGQIDRLAAALARGERFDELGSRPVAGFILSTLLGGLFLKGVSAPKRRPWHASARCTGCGTCVSVCPCRNIAMKAGSSTSAGSGRPAWGADCVLCMACIEWCPEKAVEYGKATEKRGRYHHPRVTTAQLRG